MSQDILNLWLHDEHVGEVERLRTGRPRLRFAAEARARWGDGARVLSYSLPLGPKRIDGPAIETYLENLLPEGALRAQLERQHGVRPGDAFGLLRYIGYECAGAVQLTPESAPPTGHLKPLPDDEVIGLVEDLPTLSAPEGEAITASLGGVQSKLLLTRTEAGWAWPAAGAPSTHIIKPEPIEPSAPIPRIVEFEHWSLELARAAGVPGARSTLERFGDRLAIVVERYDRARGDRLHQEDFAQALGIRPLEKYESSYVEPGRLRRVAIGPGLESADPGLFRDALLRLVTFNLIIGNGDAHAKNYSLLLRDGLFSIAPAYDVAPVFYVNPRFSDFGMSVAGQRGLRHITLDHLMREAASWGMSEDGARTEIRNVATSVQSALVEVEVPEFVAPVAEQVRAAAARFAG